MMKKKMRVWVVMVLIFAMTVFCFTGCGSSDKDADGAIVLDWYMMNPIAVMDTENVEKVEAAVNEIIFPQTGAKIDFHFYEVHFQYQKDYHHYHLIIHLFHHFSFH